MADQNKINKTAKDITSLYIDEVNSIVSKLVKVKKNAGIKDQIEAVQKANIQEAIKVRLSSVRKEYLKAHLDILKDTQPAKKKK